MSRIDELEMLASSMIGDGQEPNVFFVTYKGDVVLVTTDGEVAHRMWQEMPRGVETSLEDRLYGVIASTEPDSDEPGAPLVSYDDWKRR